MRVILFSLLVAACNTPAAPQQAPVPGTFTPKGKVVLTAGGEALTEDVVEVLTRGMPAAQMEQLKASGRYKQMLEQMALGQVLYKRAVEQKLYEEDDVKIALAMAQRDALAKEVVGRVGEAAVTDDKLKEAYDSRKVQYAVEQRKARHVLVETEEEATAVRAELLGGADFAAVAKAKSKDKASGERGGDLGWFKKGQMVPEFSDAAFGATADEIIGPVKSKFGFHVLQVTERRDSIPLDEVRDQLENTIKQTAVKEFIDKVTAEANITWPDEGGEAKAEGGEAKAGDGHDH